jgi:predicted O-methyltransferase YrrM
VIEKIRTVLWFSGRPKFWAQARELGLRKFRANRDDIESARRAHEWAAENAVSRPVALARLRLLPNEHSDFPSLPVTLLDEARALVAKSGTTMGGPGDIDLIYAAAVLSESRRTVETGVAYGWSSLAILAALKELDGEMLVSVDMPYPKLNNESFVGIAVPERFRDKWKLIREPDRNGLRKAIAYFRGEIDLCHYDSDKSYWGRQFGCEILWRALKPGGVMIVDDIQDNLSFREFITKNNVPFAVTEYRQKYVGMIRKP